MIFEMKCAPEEKKPGYMPFDYEICLTILSWPTPR
ncbi:Uncharacterised protein [Leminorella richardii]|uniref:Uncharacterized protein n=1 Tax=Leminorella richardii TaxID=158841 RepID=A0A2X4UHU3_9GAMM|nr:Uncharacterised protein [Leminorella richardii]